MSRIEIDDVSKTDKETYHSEAYQPQNLRAGRCYEPGGDLLG